MKFKHSISCQNIKKKRKKFSALLSSELFFHRSNQIKMALNHEPILSWDFRVKRAKSKIDTGKKRQKRFKDKEDIYQLNSSVHSEKETEIKDIPEELYKIFLEYEKKFLKIDEKYNNIKNYNDEVLNFWHFINQSNKKKERDILLKKFFSKIEKNDVNLYSDEVKKISNNLFKINPLLCTFNNSDIFFHYLSEFNKYNQDENKFNKIKRKIIIFLEKLRDLLEYIGIKNDTYLDPISKEIKLQNSRFIKENDSQIRNQIIKEREIRYLHNMKDINESRKMIEDTKNTLSSLDRNKNLFEDIKIRNFSPISSRNFNSLKIGNYKNIMFYKNYNNRTPSPNLTKINFNSPKTSKMGRTSSTGFYLSANKFYQKNKTKANKREKNISIKNYDLNHSIKHIKMKKFDKRYLNGSSSNLINYNRRSKLFNSLKYNKFSIKNIDHINKNISQSQMNSQRNLYQSLEIDEKGENISNLSSSKLINKEKQKTTIIFPSNLNKKNLTSKKIKIINEPKKDSNINSIKEKGKTELTKNSCNYNKYLDRLICLYDDIKNKNNINREDDKNINKYFTSKGKNTNINFNSVNIMEIIKRSKNITNELDIEQKTKKVFHPYLSFDHIQKLDNVKNINKKMLELEVNYMEKIFKYKSKNS